MLISHHQPSGWQRGIDSDELDAVVFRAAGVFPVVRDLEVKSSVINIISVMYCMCGSLKRN